MVSLTDYFYIATTILFTVYGQLILKWRIGRHGAFPAEAAERFRFFVSLLLDPLILSGLVGAFIASLAWMAAMTKFELSYAYPFMSLNFVVVLLLSAWLFSEPLTAAKVVGVGLIVAGTMVVARG